MGSVSLLPGKRPAVKATFQKKHWVLELETPSCALGLYNYLRFCLQNFQEDTDSHWQTISKNTDPLLKRIAFPHFQKTVFEIIRQQQPGLTSDNYLQDVEFKHLNELVHHIAVGHFASPQNNARYFSEATHQIISDITAAAIKRTATLDTLMVHKVMTDLVQTKAVLRELDLVDLRIDFGLKFLLHIYKRLFFNQVLSILGNLLGQMAQEEAERPLDAIVNFPIFVDFFKTIRTFFTEFVPFKHLRNFCTVTLDFKRKLFYYFFCFFRQILEKSSLRFSYTSLLSMLNGIFYLVRENEQLITDFIEIFGEHEQYMRMLLNFKRMFFRLAEVIMAKVRTHLRQLVQERLAEVPVVGFDIDQVVKKRLAEAVTPLEKVHTHFRVKIIRFFFVAVLEEFITLVEKEGPEFTSGTDFGEAMDKLREFFSTSFENQTFENYLKFLEYYQKFLKSRSQSTCETALAMMKTILSEEISDSLIEKVIRSKNFDGLNFRRGQFLDRVEKLIARHKQGLLLAQRKQEARRKLGGMLLLGANCFKFAKILRRKLIKRKVNVLVEDEAVGPAQEPPKDKVALAKLDKFRKSLPIAFFEPTDFEGVSGDGVKEVVRQAILKSPPLTYTLAYESEKLVVESQNKKLMRIFHPGKFSAIERIDLSGSRAVLLTYRQHERVVLIADKEESQTKLFEKIGKLVEIYKEARFSPSRFANQSPPLRHGQGAL